LLSRSLAAQEIYFHLETAANLLKLLERVSTIFSKWGLKSLDNPAGFDSAIRRFDPSRPSQACPIENSAEFSGLGLMRQSLGKDRPTACAASRRVPNSGVQVKLLSLSAMRTACGLSVRCTTLVRRTLPWNMSKRETPRLIGEGPQRQQRIDHRQLQSARVIVVHEPAILRARPGRSSLQLRRAQT
jgi:hypothetical protein